ncbi:MAG TPA: PLP-dependent aminotransferase family protein [candidate division Zixibacteria bacterium]|nr:PLP-dependent aminotransferase family protein [candidate division Zixibacteria bacterium]
MSVQESSWKPELESSDQPLYMAIVKAIEDDVHNGRLSDETKLPTHRELADRLSIAIGTVTRAYAEAEQRGLIRSEGRRGTFVGSPRTGRSILARIAARPPMGIDLSKNHPVYHLDPDLPSALKRLARSRNAHSLLEYPPAAGFSRHRESGAKWLQSLGASAEPESVFVTSGAQHALSVILSAETKHGDSIAVERFTYTGIRALAEQMNLQVVGIQSDESGMLPDALEAACRHRRIRVLYCNPSLQNPTNIIWPKERRKEIAEVAERHGITVIEDEIMRPLLAGHPGYISTLIPEQSYLTISASKSIAAGLRIGFVVAPSRSHRKMIEGLNASCLGVTPLVGELFSLWLEDGTAERIIAQRRIDTARRQEVAAEVFDGHSFRNHPASYHLWLELPGAWTSMQLAMEAQLRGVVVAPGEAFAVDQKSPVTAVRLSVIVPETMEILRNGLETVAGVLQGSPGQNVTTV